VDDFEKKERLHQTLIIHFKPFVPCTTYDCTNEATVGTITYNHAEKHWELTAICKACTHKMMKIYGE
jgi:hypothetical protein